jgi:hypothetical protein
LYSPPNIIGMVKPRRIRWVGHAALTRENGSAFRVLIGKCYEKILQRPRRGWENILAEIINCRVLVSTVTKPLVS